MTPQDVEAIKQATELIKLTYSDLMQPATQELGKALGTVIGLGNTVLLPIKLLNEKCNILFTRHMNNYQEKLKSIPEGKIASVHPEIGVPILDRLTYVQNEELANMFINLLASASSTDTMNEAHPSFIKIIDSLTPDEAKIIALLSPGSPRIVYISLREKTKPGSFKIRSGPLTLLDEKIALAFPENIHFYLDNLVGLGIIHDPFGDLYVPGDSKVYSQLRNKYSDKIAKLESEASSTDSSVEAIRGYYQITQYGEMFRKAVIN